MRKALLFFVCLVFLVFSSVSFAQNFDTVKQDKSGQSGISEKEAKETMDKLADQSKEKLSIFLKQEPKKYISISYVNAKQALEMVDKVGQSKVLVDKSYVKVNGIITSTYVLFIPE